MSTAFFSFISLALFMLHEFDELVFIRPWIEAQGENPAYQAELFISGKAHYRSTEGIALMIGEEFLLASLLLAAASFFAIPELAAALVIGHLLHLLVHIKEIGLYRRFTPGSFTALVTFPLVSFCLFVFWRRHQLHYLLLLIMTPLVLALILVNLSFLHRRASRVEAWINHFVS